LRHGALKQKRQVQGKNQYFATLGRLLEFFGDGLGNQLQLEHDVVFHV
jgi:hypothetical protein